MFASRLFKGWDAATIYLINATGQEFLYRMIFAATMIYMITVAGLNPLQLVLVGTVLEGTIFIFEVPTGIVADSYSRRLSVIVGVLIVGLSFVVLGLFASFALILVSQCLWGLGYTFTSGATSAWIVDEIGEERAAGVFLRETQLGSLAGIAGALGGIGLGSVLINLPILLGGGLFVALGLFLMLAMPETGFKPTPSEERSSWQQMGHLLGEGIRTVRGRPLLVVLFAITVIFGAFSEGFDRLSDAHIIHDIGFPAWPPLQPIQWLGGADILGGFITAGLAGVIRKRLDTTRHRLLATSLLAINALIAGGVMAFGLSRTFAAGILAVMLAGLMRSLRGPLTLIWLNQHIESRVRATVLSMAGQIDGFGQMLGGPVVGWIGTVRSIRAALVVSGLALTPALPLYAWTIRHQPDEAAELEEQPVTV